MVTELEKTKLVVQTCNLMCLRSHGMGTASLKPKCTTDGVQGSMRHFTKSCLN